MLAVRNTYFSPISVTKFSNDLINIKAQLQQIERADTKKIKEGFHTICRGIRVPAVAGRASFSKDSGGML